LLRAHQILTQLGCERRALLARATHRRRSRPGLYRASSLHSRI
jgi:hypothetical protein